MIPDKIKELAKLKAAVAKLESKVMVAREAELATLHQTFGYEKLKDFIKALKQAASHRPRAVKVKGTKPAKVRKQKRGKITPEVKAHVKAAVEAGKSGLEIGKLLGISPASVQNVKKELGLVKARVSPVVPPAPPV